ncbi:MAG TPA: O-antigen ligase family protein [Gaiellaceae bacterium]|nr:O-antigen ligase family protein [Gaiellaceae bacterium]
MSSEVARAAGAIGGVGLGLLLVATRRDLRVLGLAAWAAGCLLLAIYLAPHGHHRVLAAAAVVGLGCAAVGAWVVLRYPWLLACATLACVPARIPVHVGSTQANLLLPLYAVVAVAALALAWQLYDDDARPRELGPLAWPLGAFVGWEGLSLLWSEDVRQGAIEMLFFVLPFGLLAVALARLPWSRAWVLTLYVQLALMGLIFAVIGIVQYETRNIFWNPKVRVDNAYAPNGWFYRVNSVFYDPSIYGRFLVLAVLASLVVVLRRRRDPLWAIAAMLTIVVTWAGLLPSFSQSSFVALLAAVIVAAIVAWRRRSLFLIAAAIVVLVGATVASPAVRHRASLSHVTSGRSTLVGKGLRIAAHHPVLGVGVGGFKHAYGELAHLRGKEPKAAASHTTPVTVVAETGVPGLLLLVWLVAAALATAFRRLQRGFDGAARLAFGLALIAILVHCLFYNALFEDPSFWALLSLSVVGLRTAPAPREAVR